MRISDWSSDVCSSDLDLEKRLDPRNFQRVHRSTIVNLNQVKQVKPHTNGECFLVLGSGAQVKVSRSYRDVVARFVHLIGSHENTTSFPNPERPELVEGPFFLFDVQTKSGASPS